MALKSTIYRLNLDIADIDNGHYAQHALTLACHPSETEERLMVRMLAFALNAHQIQTLCNGDAHLAYGPGLSNPDEPDLALTDFSGRIRLWIEVGQPDERPIVRACGKADGVRVYAYSHATDVWWNAIGRKLDRLDHLEVWRIPDSESTQLAEMVSRGMSLQATIQDGGVLVGDGNQAVSVTPERLR